MELVDWIAVLVLLGTGGLLAYRSCKNFHTDVIKAWCEAAGAGFAFGGVVISFL